MMQDLVSHNGKYRNEGVGIFDGNQVVHLAPPADRVPFLMSDLLFLKSSASISEISPGSIPQLITSVLMSSYHPPINESSY